MMKIRRHSLRKSSKFEEISSKIAKTRWCLGFDPWLSPFEDLLGNMPVFRRSILHEKCSQWIAAKQLKIYLWLFNEPYAPKLFSTKLKSHSYGFPNHSCISYVKWKMGYIHRHILTQRVKSTPCLEYLTIYEIYTHACHCVIRHVLSHCPYYT